ncbi:YfhO family protein [Flavobacterium sp. xlx-214]|uniref:YfhO family protein n=1 Tax=unclassified Flavobacterium TaxID=196869 RepID=UPI0013D4821F|nr:MULTISPECIES: YfhO family protein [unclassified Flavobacterium]MBA5791432.1 YfhO family protein [Flavobacterium sp. xlx-221]QMI83417.1 YfhO family protein [Flavobacterium sp. xlx-214]
MKNFKNYVPHILALCGFIVVALAYFYPVLSGKQILQTDIVQYTGMAKELNDFRQTNNEETYWVNNAFGGMPTYQLGAKYPHNYIKQLDSIIRFLPRPADYVFLYFIGFYILLLTYKVKPLKAFIGALLFGFSTYLIVILGAGHNAKAHAIAYMPLVLAGVHLVFKKKYLLGGILTMIAAALEISTNHFQMTYYLLLFLLIVCIYYTIHYIKEKQVAALLKMFGVFAIAGILAIGLNATNLLATSEYAQFSTRSDSSLTIAPDGSPKASTNAMTHEYITEYSYGIFETFNLLVPRITGGGNGENIGTNSKTYQFVYNLLQSQGYDPAQAEQFANHAPTYWGSQPIVAAPAYIGAVVLFLAVLCFFVDDRKVKYYLGTGALVSILLSWGHHFFLTDFLIDNFPMYNKFRAITSIQVIAELCFPVLAILGLQAFFRADKENQLNALKKTSMIFGGLIVLLFVAKSMVDFVGANDQNYAQMFQQAGSDFLSALIEDRKALYNKDLLRTLFFIAASAAVLFAFIKDKLNIKTAVILVGALGILDLVMIDLNYVNKDNFVPKQMVQVPFQATPADAQILSDKSQFRVFEQAGGFSSARSSFFHHSLGGYHAAKPKKIQDLFDYQITQQNIEVLNMLNVKYVIGKDEQGQDIPLKNPDANGNAWFVQDVKKVKNADEMMQQMKTFKSKQTALVYDKEAVSKSNFAVDSLAQIKLTNYQPNKLVYQSSNKNDGFAVFSEVYYPKGWKISIDGKPVEMKEVNYTLRGLEIPAGNHKIEFSFDPEVIKTGSFISLITSIIALIIVILGIFFTFKKQQNNKVVEM